MKRSNYIFIILLTALLINVLPLTTTADEGILTLQQAKELALKNSNEIKEQKLNVDKADKAKRDADAAYTRIVANYFTEAQEATVTNAREGYRAALNAYTDSKTQFQNKKLSLEYDVESLYFSILNTERDLTIMGYDLRLKADLAKIERLKLELGMSTENKVSEAEIALDSLHSSYNGKNTGLQNSKATMNKYIGREPNVTLRLDSAVQLDFKYKITSVDETTKKALENYLAINQLERTIAEKEKDIEWYGYNQSEKVEDLNNSIKGAKISKENAEKSLKQSIANIYDKIELNQRACTNYEMSLKIAQNNNEIDKQKYELGMISTIELKISEKTLEQAKKDYSKAQYDYYLSLRELELIEKGILLSSSMK